MITTCFPSWASIFIVRHFLGHISSMILRSLVVIVVNLLFRTVLLFGTGTECVDKPVSIYNLLFDHSSPCLKLSRNEDN
ncbi:hypothetical protein DFH11DRAFT_67396 [Phellopilus nigrolimitatus]|nr:hypothetical protein DFH11DRAFT_67396 [Phellopilus nigrolimitatus]